MKRVTTTTRKSLVHSTQNRTRRALLDTIKCQTGLNLSRDATRFFRTFDTWAKHEGIRSATLRLKNCYLVVLCHSLKQPNPQIPFLRTTAGFPTVFLYLKKYCRTPYGIQAVLSLLGWYRGVRAPGKPDFSSITDEGPVIPESLLTEVVQQIKPNERFGLQTLAPPQVELRSKKGPNGPATLTCLEDLKALPDEMYDWIINLAELQEGDDFVETIEELREMALESTTTKPRLFHSKLAIKQELGGKDRVFAIVDFWSQSVLKPLHLKLAQILRTINNDCTYDQGKGVELIKTWTATSSEVYSYDLTSATNRFPLSLQSRVVEELTCDKEYSSNWTNLIANRSFAYKKNTYKWKVGQPLGAYSSWPVFAYSHHLVVRAAAKRVGVSPSYFLLGDDIVILGKDLGQEYLRLMETLGVGISWSKSLFGCQAEFAKRVFFKGVEISPAPIKMLSALQQDPLLIKEVCEHLHSRSSNKTEMERLRSSALNAFSHLHGRKRKEILIIGRSIIPEGTTPILANRVVVSWPPCHKFNYDTVYSFIKYKYLMSQYQKSSVLTTKFSNQIRELELPGTTRKGDPRHPIWKAVEKQSSFFTASHRAVGKYWTLLTKSQYLPKDSLPDIKSFDLDSLTKSHRSRIRHQANVLLQTHSALLKAKQEFKELLELQVISPSSLIRAIQKDQSQPSQTKARALDK